MVGSFSSNFIKGSFQGTKMLTLPRKVLLQELFLYVGMVALVSYLAGRRTIFFLSRRSRQGGTISDFSYGKPPFEIRTQTNSEICGRLIHHLEDPTCFHDPSSSTTILGGNEEEAQDHNDNPIPGGTTRIAVSTSGTHTTRTPTPRNPPTFSKSALVFSSEQRDDKKVLLVEVLPPSCDGDQCGDCANDILPPPPLSKHSINFFTPTIMTRRGRAAVTLIGEMFIQPAMLVHPNPKTVAIYISDNDDGLTKTRTILDQLKPHMHMLDKVFIFHDARSTTNPLGRPLATVIRGFSCCDNKNENFAEIEVVDIVDVSSWSQQPVFDLVFVDQSEEGRLSATTIGTHFWSDHLDTENGILVTIFGGNHVHDRLKQIQAELVQSGGFAKVADYDEYVARSPSGKTIFQSCAVAFKNIRTYAHWHMNEAEYTLRMHQRQIVDSDSLYVFDGATMTTLAFSSRIITRAFCELEYGDACNDHEWLHALNPYHNNVPFSDLEVKHSSMGELAGRGVFTKVDASNGTYFDLETSSHAVRASWTTTALVFPPNKANALFQTIGYPVQYYFDGYGFYNEPFGQFSTTVDSGALTFSNHGCNSTYNIGEVLSLNEFEIDLSQPPPDDFFTTRRPVYNPLSERNVFHAQTVSRAQRDIAAGEELLDNYLSFGGSTYFVEEVRSLLDQCTGIAGEVEEFQMKKKKRQRIDD